VEAVGNVANEAGLNFEQLSAIIAKTMEQTRQSGSQIGNGLKTIMVRLSKASNLSDEVDNETLSNASKALHEIGVEVYETTGEYREFDTIMTELAEKWDTLNDAQQANVSYQIAATRQTSVLKAILQNWTSSMDLATEATEANGNALENQEKYEESIAGRMQALSTEAEAFWTDFINTDTIKTGIDLLTGLVSILDSIINKFGALTPLSAIGGIALNKMLGYCKVHLSNKSKWFCEAQ
jgi:TP901 family phage tail tape measure protein